MPRYLISFDDGSMDHIPEADWPAVGEAAHAVVRDAKAAGVWIFGGGLQRQQSSIVATNGTITGGPVPETKAVVGGVARRGARLGSPICQSVPVFPRRPRDHVRSGILNRVIRSPGWKRNPVESPWSRTL